MYGRLRQFVLLIPALLIACDAAGNTARDWQGEFRDSAGIRIVVNPSTGLWPEASAWRVEADLSIGAIDGDSTAQFGHVADVAVDTRGRILVLDQQARAVRVFDPAGVFLYSLGGPGEGPGELSRSANAVLVSPHDTVFVPDYAQSRINVYDPAGALAPALPLAPPPGGRSWERLEDGRFLFRGVTIRRDESNRYRISDGLFVTRREGGQDTLLTFDYAQSDLGGPGNPVVPLIVNGAFWVRLANGSIAWSSFDHNGVLVHAPEGALARVVKHPAWLRSVMTESDRLQLRELLRMKLTMLGGDAASVDQLRIVTDEAFPAITSLRAGPDNTLWVQRMGSAAGMDAMSINAEDAGSGLGGNVWDVLDAEGRFLGAIVVPERFRVLHITRTAVYGVRKDSLDVEHVERLRLIRPAPDR
ncbi:MAG: 6-bladed beta-propeller [Gemmatimonadetes bacterium]|nr:6-bladed beta-propeller [Gemmatimonadota bacterium]